jgi:hypothetical protein
VKKAKSEARVHAISEQSHAPESQPAQGYQYQGPVSYGDAVFCVENVDSGNQPAISIVPCMDDVSQRTTTTSASGRFDPSIDDVLQAAPADSVVACLDNQRTTTTSASGRFDPSIDDVLQAAPADSVVACLDNQRTTTTSASGRFDPSIDGVLQAAPAGSVVACLDDVSKRAIANSTSGCLVLPDDGTSLVPVPSTNGAAVFSISDGQVGCDAAVAMTYTLQVPQRETLFVLDGASTVAVVQDPAICYNIRPASLNLKVGGQGKPTLVHCKQVGMFRAFSVVDDKKFQLEIEVRIIPGFGVNILPECYFLQNGYSINKNGCAATVVAPSGGVVLRAQAQRHDRSWLFYVALRQDPVSVPEPAREASNVHYTVAPLLLPVSTYVFHVDEGERELQALLPLSSELDACYRVGRSVSSAKDAASLAQLWHSRFAHRDMRECVKQIGLPMPKNLPACVTCIKAKSKRGSLTGSGGLHDAQRPGQVFAWDHCGPFPRNAWDGSNFLSLKVCLFSGKVAPVMTNTTANCVEEWSSHVLQVEAHFGRQVVSRLVTDDAPYWKDKRMEDFNKARGIVHTPTPPYTQELNPAERVIGTVLSMTRAALEPTNAPGGAYGECILAQCFVLDVTPHRQGGKLTRKEKWHGKPLPRQHLPLRVWGCAAWVHLFYGDRGKIGNPSKLDARASLHMFVGYAPAAMGWRVASLPDFKIRTALHVTFVEDHFPCRTDVNRELAPFGTFLPSSGLTGSDRGAPQAHSYPQRARVPSATALEAIANGPPSPPDFAYLVVDHALATFYGEKQHQLDEHLNYIEHCIDDVFMETYCAVVYAATPVKPSTYPKALLSHDGHRFRQALNREVTQHNKNRTFGPALSPDKLPPGVKPIPLSVLAKVKRCGLHKARAIIKGFHMQQGVDFNETFAPVPCLSVLRLLLAWAAKHDWEIKQGDITTAFLLADMDTEVYVRVPNWFCENATGNEKGFSIRRLLKAVPGIPQGPRLWHQLSKSVFRDLNLVQCKSEWCLYYCHKRKLYLLVWVDDLFLFFPSSVMEHAVRLWADLNKAFDLGEWEDINDCLSCMVTRDRSRRTITMSQEAAVHALVERANLTDANPADTPMVPGRKLSKADGPSPEDAKVMVDDQKLYLSLVASCIWLVSWTRPDIAYAVSKLCRFMHNPGTVHFTALKRLLRYLRDTSHYGLKYSFVQDGATASSPKRGIYAYYDASHADCPDTRRSTVAYVFFFEGAPISWKTRLHTYVTTSTNHSEYCSAAAAAREAKFFEKVAVELGFSHYVQPIDMFSDSKGAIAMAYNPVMRAASKHVDLADHYAREMQERGTITISYVGTRDMVADILTKPLGTADFARHAAVLVHKLSN